MEDKDYQDLMESLRQANSIANGRPDHFQYQQNQLLRDVVNFLLKPYLERKLNEEPS